jgi:hypothetical protein
MRLLSIATLLDKRHDDIPSRHKRQLLRDPPRDHTRVHDKAL